MASPSDLNRDCSSDSVDHELAGAHGVDVARRATLTALRRSRVGMPGSRGGEAPATDAAHELAARSVASPTVEERPADAVEDRLVAGEPATNLLGAWTGDAFVNGAVQRKAISDTTPEERQQQHDRADLASLLGLESEMALAAKQLQATAFEMLRIVTTPLVETSLAARLEALQAKIDKATAELQVLNNHVSGHGTQGMTSESVQLAPRLATLNQALAHLGHAAQQATQYAIKHYDRARFDVRGAKDQLETLYKKLGLQRTRIQYRDVDADRQSQLRDDALRKNMVAVSEAARSVRMSLTKGADGELQGDLWKVIRHVAAITAMLQQESSPAGLMRHKPRMRQVLVEVRQLEDEIVAVPALANLLKADTFSAQVRYLAEESAKW